MIRPLRIDDRAPGSATRRGFAALGGVAVQSAARVLTSLAIGRIGGPAVLGIVATAIALAQLLALLWPSSAGSAASKFVARSRGAKDFREAAAVASHLSKRTLQSSVVLALVGFAVWPALFTGGRDWVSGSSLVALLVLGLSGYGFARGLHFGASQVTRAFRWDMVTSSIGLGGVVLCLALGVRGPALVAPLAFGSLIFAFGGWYWQRWHPIAPGLRREIDHFIFLATAGTLASAGFLQLSTIVSRTFAGAAGAGHYAAAMILATPIAIIGTSVSLVLFPAMSEAIGRGDVNELRRHTDLATRASVLAMVALTGVLAICSRAIIALMWSHGYSSSSDILPVLLAAILVGTLVVPSSNAVSSATPRGIVISTAASWIGLTSGVAYWVGFGASQGLMGVAIGYMLGSVATAAVCMGWVWLRHGHRWASMVVRTTLGVCLEAAILIIQDHSHGPLWTDLVAAAAFVAGWLAIDWTDVRYLLRNHRTIRSGGVRVEAGRHRADVHSATNAR